MTEKAATLVLLAERIRSEANVSDRAGQYDNLNVIADELDRLALAEPRVSP